MPQTRTRSEQRVHAEADGCVVLTIEGCLDAVAGEALVMAALAAVADEAPRLEIDLCSLTGFTGDGACSLVACRQVCSGLPDGLHYRTGQGPGREALLAAYAELD